MVFEDPRSFQCASRFWIHSASLSWQSTTTDIKEGNGYSPKLGFRGGASGKESICQCRRLRKCEFDLWIGKIPWRRKWQPTPVFLPGKSMDREAWLATVHGVAKSWTWLSDWTQRHTVFPTQDGEQLEGRHWILHSSLYLLWFLRILGLSNSQFYGRVILARTRGNQSFWL